MKTRIGISAFVFLLPMTLPAGQTTWIGASNADWSVASNWSAGLPMAGVTGVVATGAGGYADSSIAGTVQIDSGGGVNIFDVWR